VVSRIKSWAKGLARKVGLRRSAAPDRRTPIARGPAPKRRKRLRAVSLNRASRFDARRACVADVLRRSGGRCEARVAGVCLEHAGRPYPVDVHERRLRSQGGDPTDPANCLVTCRPCHDFAHAHPAEANRLGLILRRGDVAGRGAA
jgi:hypothetical protein